MVSINSSDKKNVQEVFADGVSQVSFSEVFRIIFGRIDPQSNSSNDGIPLLPNLSVIMTVNGLLQLRKAINEVIDQMVQAGVLDQKQLDAPQGQPAQGEAGPTVAPSVGANPSSSNFE